MIEKLEIKEEDIFHIPILTHYKYLGIKIDHRGNIQKQFKKLKKVDKYLRDKLRYVVRFLPLKQKFLLWIVYILPHFTYTIGAMAL